MKRSILGGICGGLLVAVATACGGTVSVPPGSETGTPRDQLQANGPERCKAACVTIANCGLGSKDCACACPPCAAGSTSCECPPCDCGADPMSPEKCESDCNEAVQKMLTDNAGCEKKMLSLLDCLGAATCNLNGNASANAEVCSTEQDAVKGCTESHVSPAPAAGGGSDPGSSSGSTVEWADAGSAGTSSGAGSAGGSGVAPSGPIVTCRGGAGSAGGSSGGAVPSPGSVVCETAWDGCSDGHSYGVLCVATTSALMTCTCTLDGASRNTFPATTCMGGPAEVSGPCGWNLR